MFVTLLGIIVFTCWVLIWLCGTHRLKAPQFVNCNRSCQRYLFRVLWMEGFYPDVRYKIDQLEVDLAFPYSKIAIECGWNDWESTDLERVRSKKKARLLKDKGWSMIHLTPKEIYGSPHSCIMKIEDCLLREKQIF